MKIKWDEPKSIYRSRWKNKVMTQFIRTSWLRVSILLLVVLPVAVYYLTTIYRPRDFHWYYLPIIIIICTAFMGFEAVFFFYVSKSTVTMDDKGISLGGPDGRLRKYLYDKMSAIELVPNSLGGYSLIWQYEGKEIMRGINLDINISEIKKMIENNSYKEVTIKQP